MLTEVSGPPPARFAFYHACANSEGWRQAINWRRAVAVRVGSAGSVTVKAKLQSAGERLRLSLSQTLLIFAANSELSLAFIC